MVVSAQGNMAKDNGERLNGETTDPTSESYFPALNL